MENNNQCAHTKVYLNMLNVLEVSPILHLCADGVMATMKNKIYMKFYVFKRGSMESCDHLEVKNIS